MENRRCHNCTYTYSFFTIPHNLPPLPICHLHFLELLLSVLHSSILLLLVNKNIVLSLITVDQFMETRCSQKSTHPNICQQPLLLGLLPLHFLDQPMILRQLLLENVFKPFGLHVARSSMCEASCLLHHKRPYVIVLDYSLSLGY